MKHNDPVNGKFGKYGGKYIPETLIPAIEELELAYEKYKRDAEFQKELSYYLTNYAGRPTPLYFAKNLSDHIGGARIYLKREDLLHGGAHKTNNALGQALLAKRMGKKGLLQKRVLVSTVLERLLLLQSLGWLRKFIWAQRTYVDRVLM